jgi:hypothetical protein
MMMALQLNLLHEQFSEQRQRQRDPLKLGVIGLILFGVLLFLYYGWNAYQTIEIKSRLSVVERDWKKIEPKVVSAQKRSDDLNKIIGTTKVLNAIIENRFFWGPFLDILSRCVAPNAQLTSLEGHVVDDNKTVMIALDGIASAREPRSAAEDLRQLLMEQLGQAYSSVKVEFRSLEDLDTMVNVSGASLPTAHYVLSVTFDPLSPSAARPKPAEPVRTSKK